MKIKVLGTRGMIKPSAAHHSHHSGILINDDLLFDLGEKEYLKYDPEWILLTHLHSDHAFFVEENFEGKIKAEIFVPEDSAKIDAAVLTSAIKRGQYQITPVPTLHSLKVKSQGYLLKEQNGASLFYTGDFISIEKQYRSLLEPVDVVITEGSYINNHGRVFHSKNAQPYGHTGIPDIIKFFKDYTDTFVFVHFGSWFYQDIEQSKQKIQDIANEYGVKAIAGYDGLELKVDGKVEEV